MFNDNDKLNAAGIIGGVIILLAFIAVLIIAGALVRQEIERIKDARAEARRNRYARQRLMQGIEDCDKREQAMLRHLSDNDNTIFTNVQRGRNDFS